MATGKIQHVRTGRIAASGGVSPSLLIKQMGHVVTIWGYVNNINASATTAQVAIGHIYDVDYPATAVRFLTGAAGGAYQVPDKVGYGALYETGDMICIPGVTGSKAVWFDIAYIV